MRHVILVPLGLFFLTAAAIAEPALYDPADRLPMQGEVVGKLSPMAKGGGPLLNPSFEVNGGFGTEDFDQWTVLQLPGSVSGMPAGTGTVAVQSGPVSPLSATPVDVPTDGMYSAMADSLGVGTQMIYQDFLVPDGITTLRCDVYIQNSFGAFITPATLDWETVPNQHARIDLMDPAAPLGDVGAGVLMNLFITNPGDPAVQSYQTVSANISAFAGQVVRLRAAEVDNQLFFQMGVDNCGVISAVSEIPTLDGGALGLVVLLLVAGGLAILRR